MRIVLSGPICGSGSFLPLLFWLGGLLLILPGRTTGNKECAEKSQKQ